MFRRWLMLLRDGPDLLAATSTDVDAEAAERCDCNAHRHVMPHLLIRKLRPDEVPQDPSSTTR